MVLQIVSVRDCQAQNFYFMKLTLSRPSAKTPLLPIIENLLFNYQLYVVKATWTGDCLD